MTRWSPDIVALRAFVTLVRERRFSRAARVLGLSASTLSRQIRRIEGEVGAPLVVRGPADVVLTPAGKRLLVHVEHVLSLLDEARVEMSNAHNGPSGFVQAGAIATVGAYVLPNIVASFRESHPAVRLSVREGSSDVLEGLVLAGEVDFAVLGRPPRHLDLVAKSLWSEDYVLVVAENHRLARASGPVSMEDVRLEPWVVIPGSPVEPLIDALLLTAEPCEAPPTQPFYVASDNLETVRRMLEAGAGITFVPRLVLEGAPDWRLVAVPTSFPCTHREITLVHRGASLLTEAAKAFMAAIASDVTWRRCAPS